MELVYRRNDGKPGINSKKSFVSAIPTSSVYGDSFESIIDHICDVVTNDGIQRDLPVGGQNFRNARGRWFEWLVNYFAWEFFQSKNSSIRLVNLPNADKLECTDLYIAEYADHIHDLKEKLKLQDIELITSNPDFVLIDTFGMDVDVTKKFNLNTPKEGDLEFFDNLYAQFIGKCDLNSLLGYVSVKTSTRSDRRFQWLHEGNLAKSLHLHIRTREWLNDVRLLKFFCMSFDLKPKDIIALKTATTHTIASIGLVPEKSVDNAFKVTNLQDFGVALEAIVIELSDNSKIESVV